MTNKVKSLQLEFLNKNKIQRIIQEPIMEWNIYSYILNKKDYLEYRYSSFPTRAWWKQLTTLNLQLLIQYEISVLDTYLLKK